MSRRERDARDSHGKRLHSRFDREPSPKKLKRYEKPEVNAAHSSHRRWNVTEATSHGQKQRPMQDDAQLEAPPVSSSPGFQNEKKSLERKGDKPLVGTKHSSDDREIPRSRSFYQILQEPNCEKVKTSNPMFGRRLIGPDTSTYMRWGKSKAKFIINADIPDQSGSVITSHGSGIGLALQSKASFDRMKKLEDMDMSFLMGQKALELLQVVGLGGGRYRGLIDDLATAENQVSAAHAEVARVQVALRQLEAESAKEKEAADLDQEASAELIAKLEEEIVELKAASAGATSVDMKKLESDMVDRIMDSEEYKASLQASFEDGVGCALKAFINRGVVEAASIDAEGFKKECLDIAAVEDEEADAEEDADR